MNSTKFQKLVRPNHILHPLFLNFSSALHLNDDIHLSLSPTGSPTPNDDEVFEDIDLNSSQQTTNNTNNKNTDNNIPDGFKIGYRDTKSVPVRSSSWYDGFLQCFKPVMTSFMGKGKPSNSESDAQGMTFCMETFIQYFCNDTA